MLEHHEETEDGVELEWGVPVTEFVIVTRHPGLVAHLKKMGITGRVIAHAREEDVRGQIVVGVLPLHLAALANEVGVIDLNLTLEQRGRELSEEEVAAAAGPLTWYRVQAFPAVKDITPRGRA